VGFIPMFVFGLRPSTIVSMSEGSLSQAWEMLAIAPTAQNRRRTDARHWFLSDAARSRLIEIAPELTGHGLPLSKCEAYNRVYDQFYRAR
jgi:hypothetical protein